MAPEISMAQTNPEDSARVIPDLAAALPLSSVPTRAEIGRKLFCIAFPPPPAAVPSRRPGSFLINPEICTAQPTSAEQGVTQTVAQYLSSAPTEPGDGPKPRSTVSRVAAMAGIRWPG